VRSKCACGAPPQELPARRAPASTSDENGIVMFFTQPLPIFTKNRSRFLVNFLPHRFFFCQILKRNDESSPICY
jgi:hypothetical protein